MVIGVTFVNIEPGYEKVVHQELLGINGVKDVYHIFGEADFVVISNVDGLSALNNLVDKIREGEHIVATHTVIGAELR